MTRRIAVAALAVAAAVTLLSACGSSGEAERAHIVVTTNILGDVVENIAGDEAEVTTLMKPDADPHSFEISAREAAQMGSADLLVSNGLGLEEGLQQHLDRAMDEGVRAVVAGEHIQALAYSSGDSDGAPDPHFWTDPARMVAVVDAVERALVEVEGIDADAVHRNAEDYRAALATLDAEMTTAFAAIPADGRALVTNHHVFGYLAERFGFRVVGAVVPSGTTLAAPSAADLRDLADAITQAGVSAIFAESSQPDRLVRVLASEVGIDVEVVELYSESLSAPGGAADTYLTMMRTNTERIAESLTR